MALEYWLYLGTSWSASEVAAEMESCGRAALADGAVTAHGLRIGVSERWAWVEADEPEDPFMTPFGFRWSVMIQFRLDKFSNFDAQIEDMLRITDRVLDRVPSDLMLEFPESDTVWLVRVGGELTLSEREELWPPARRALIGLPYRRALLEYSE